ncbi:LysR family transcriptional regulator [Pontibacterium sp.]|uniref:LysR family transcriptional regulator n=1 Tax=Pontibacterium sp. TaxID=2036026 RepID=UPI003565FE0E
MKAFKDLEFFICIAETGSLTAAAHRLDLTPAAASAALKRLEAELAVQLVIRSTRSLRLTQEGEVFLRYAEQSLQLMREGLETLQSGRSLVQGVIQLSAPSDLGRNLVIGWLDAFQAQFPNVEIRLQLSDRIADVFRQPVDVALRYGQPADANFVAIPVAANNRRVLCAAPEYLERVGTPQSLHDLDAHNCLCFMVGEYVHDRWRFFGADGETSVLVSGNRVADDGDAVRRWALAGQGIAYKAGLDIAEDLKAGRLVRLCEEWQGEPAPLNMICVDRRQLTPAVRELRDFLTERCAELSA